MRGRGFLQASGISIVLLLGGFAGCAQVLGIDADRKLADGGTDSANIGFSAQEDAGADVHVIGTGPWDCLEDTAPAADPSVQVSLAFYAYNAVLPSTVGDPDSGSDLIYTKWTGLPGTQLRGCPDPLDPQCERTGTAWQTADDAGHVDMTVQEGFGGFFQVRRNDLIPLDFYPPLVTGIDREQLWISMMTAEAASAIGSALGVPLELGPDSGTGMLFLGAMDCYDHNASGVAFTLSAIGSQTLIFYLKNGLPSTSETATTGGPTGGGGAINVPAGAVTITATKVDGRMPLGSINVILTSGGIVSHLFRVRKH